MTNLRSIRLLREAHFAVRGRSRRSDDAGARAERPSPDRRPSWTDILRRLLLSGVTGLAAAVVARSLDADTLPAVVLGAACPQLLEQLAERYRWRTPTLAALATLLGLVYGRAWVRERLSGAAPAVSSAKAAAITVVAVVVSLAAIGATTEAAPASLSGTWQTTAFTVERQSGLVDETPAPRERWRISREPGCSGTGCAYRVTVTGPDGFTFTLTGAEDQAFIGSRKGRADCVSETPPHDIRVQGGFEDRWRYRVLPRPSAKHRPDEATVILELVATATAEARAEGCPARVTASYRASAVRIGGVDD